MNEASENFGDSPQRSKVKPPFFSIGNEILDVFLPIMGADCFAVYGYFRRMEYTNPKLTHSLRGIAQATELSVATVSRSLEVLEHLKLVKVSRFGGSRESECQLLDSHEAVIGLGAKPKRLSFTLPPNLAQHLKAEIKTLRQGQQGKSPLTASRGAPPASENLLFRVSHRNASVSPLIQQRLTRETQTGTHLLLEERRIEETPTPTPTPNDGGQAEKDKGFPDEDEKLASPLLWARSKFTGVMKDMGNHLLNSRPLSSHLTNGFRDWQSFGFDSLAVKAWRDEELTLVLSANDPEAARRGLDKYRKTWEASLRKWYECEVRVELVEAERKS